MYSVQQAAKDTLMEMEPGRKYAGFELHQSIISKLHEHGNPSMPYDSSTLRAVRQYSALYGVKCHLAARKSKYVKEVLL